MNLSLAQCHVQCYDGAAVMQGCCNGVVVQILQVEPRVYVHYTHCYSHFINLAFQDVITAIKPIKMFLIQLLNFHSCSSTHQNEIYSSKIFMRNSS